MLYEKKAFISESLFFVGSERRASRPNVPFGTGGEPLTFPI
jgi:hypothetical protein